MGECRSAKVPEREGKKGEGEGRPGPGPGCAGLGRGGLARPLSDFPPVERSCIVGEIRASDASRALSHTCSCRACTARSCRSRARRQSVSDSPTLLSVVQRLKERADVGCALWPCASNQDTFVFYLYQYLMFCNCIKFIVKELTI